VGIGDDAAVIPVRGTHALLTTDALVEGTHFHRAWFLPEEVGHKALAANLSDAAAMGGRPTHALVSLILPPATSVAAVERMYRGMRRLARREGVRVIGGNLARGERISVTIFLLGDFPKGKPLLRTGARPGDRVFVSGRPGLAYLGLRLLSEVLPPRRFGKLSARDPWLPAPSGEPAWRRELRMSDPEAAAALKRFLLPEPRVRLALALRALRPTSLIDLSDGLSIDLGHLAESGARLHIDPERLPIRPRFEALAHALGEHAVVACLRGGEDYELLFTLPPREAGRAGRAGRLAGIPITEIGEVADGRPGTFVPHGEGWAALPPLGFRHFQQK
jgi:thiamine-monophosphate kinase